MYWSRKFRLSDCKSCNYVGIHRNNKRFAEKYVCPSEDKSVEKYCDKQKGVDVEEEGGKRAERDERRGQDPKLHKSQGILVDKQEKEADGKASE